MPQVLRQNTKAILLLCFISIVTGCGFQLRGYSPTSNPHPLTEVNLDCPKSESWQFCQALRQELVQNNIQILNEASYTLKISPITQSSRVLSLQENASAAEYGLASSIHFQLINNTSQESVINHHLSLDHSYRHESTALLGKERERQELQTRLSQQLAFEVFRQISLFNVEQAKSTGSDSTETDSTGSGSTEIDSTNDSHQINTDKNNLDQTQVSQ